MKIPSNSNIKFNQKNYQYKTTINGIDYYYFLLINIKNEIHYYYTPSIQIYKEWINALKILLKYKNIYQQYIFHQIVGKGKNCSVFFAYDIINKREVAIKKISKTDLTLEDLSLIQTEVDTLKVCQHPYIVKLYEIIETYNEINIVQEYCELGNLYYYLSKVEFISSEEEIVNYVHNISKAVYSLHNLGIVHRDLKLSNIALTKKNNKTEIRILDFGLSKILGPNQSCNEGYGTPGYAAPEVISRLNYSFEADIWSIGVITYFLCMRKLPFDYIRDGKNELDMIENTLLDDVKFDYNIMRKYSKYAEQFIRDLMNKNVSERPNITEVLEHPWFQLFFKKEVKKRIINTYKTEFYANPDIEDLYTYDENVENDNSKDVRANYLLYTNVNNK
jgi:serine/threonine protein kinase